MINGRRLFSSSAPPSLNQEEYEYDYDDGEEYDYGSENEGETADYLIEIENAFYEGDGECGIRPTIENRAAARQLLLLNSTNSPSRTGRRRWYHIPTFSSFERFYVRHTASLVVFTTLRRNRRTGQNGHVQGRCSTD